MRCKHREIPRGATTDSLLAHGGTDIAEVAETQRSQSFLVGRFFPGIQVISDPNALPDLKKDAPCDLCAFASSAMRVPPFNMKFLTKISDFTH